MKERKRRRRVAEAVSKLLGKTKTSFAGDAGDEQSPDETVEQPKPKGPNFEKPVSRRAVDYQPHRSRGVKIRDPRGTAYQVSAAGELRALNKPRSREKRRREEAAKKKQGGADRSA